MLCRNGFNPCFGGSHIVTDRPGATRCSCTRFQSLFWWISYCDIFILVFMFPTLTCFNPCFGGSHIVTRLFNTSKISENKFQSLFWWISYCDWINAYCCKGHSWFQSLFWWISYCDDCRYGYEISSSRVSILVLVDLIL